MGAAEPMVIYTVHLRRRGADTELALIKEGLSWPAFAFSALWALWHRLWLVAAVLLAVHAGLGAMLAAMGLNPAGRMVLGVAVAGLLAVFANDLRRWTLERRGFARAGIVSAADRFAAEHAFLAANPGLAADMLRSAP